MKVKDNNEITVKIKGDFDEFINLLIKRGYEVTDKFDMRDSYFIPNDLNIELLSTRDIIAKCAIVRHVRRKLKGGEYKNITFKEKEIDKDGIITSQKAYKVDVGDVEEAKVLLTKLGFKEIMSIFEDDVVYEKDGVALAIKNIEGGDNLIEVETRDKDGYRTIEELKETITKIDIPIYTDNFFVKKAEVELDKILKRN